MPLPASLTAISIRQPWASLIAMGATDRCRVRAEFDHRGLVAVHASGRESYVDAAAAWNDLLANASQGRTPLSFPLPQAAFIAIGCIVDCVQVALGWELRLAEVRRAKEPLPNAGAHGPWTWHLPDRARRCEFWRAVDSGEFGG